MPATTSPSDPPGPPAVRRGLFARVGTACRALVTLARDPGRLDQVLVLGEAVNAGSFERIWTRIEHEPEGPTLLAERPRIDAEHVDFDALAALPDGTLGREYARFLATNGISPAPFVDPPRAFDARAAYVGQRFRQTHDVWHVLTGYAPDVEGEILLQAFTFGQTRVPSAFLITLFGTLRYGRRIPGFLSRMRDAYARGRRARFLGAVRWESRWTEPVASLRATYVG